MMRTGVENIYDNKSDDEPNDGDFGRERAVQDLMKHSHLIRGRLCSSRKIHKGSCTDPRNRQHISIPRSEEVPSQPDEMQNNNLFKKRRLDGSTECLFHRLPEDILHDILSRLSICDLLMAQRTCVAWHRMVSSCNIFRQLYDERNQESWIALSSARQNPGNFCIFNKNSNMWYLFHALYRVDPTTSWLLQGAAGGLILFVSREGKLGVGNALTRLLRFLPDTKISQRLGLESCLKKSLWKNLNSGRTTCLQPAMSINLVVHPTGKTFKVIVWGELRSRQIHALVYSSVTGTWNIKLCPDIDFKLFRRPFHSTVDGNTIYFISMFRSMLASYNTETGLFAVKEIIWRFRRWFLTVMVVQRVKIIGVLVYQSRILMVSVLVGREINVGREPTALVGLWQANPSSEEWELLTTHGLNSPSIDVAATYDGNHSITIIPRPPGSKMIFLNLDTKEWKISDGYSKVWMLLGGNSRQQQMKCGCKASFRAFHMKLKFCTAV